jgi:NADPH:quinone reductase-like Zn-dependent oxidoreductase
VKLAKFFILFHSATTSVASFSSQIEPMKVLGASKFGRQHLSFFSHHPKPSCQTPTDVIIKVEYSDLNPVDHHKVKF